MRKGNEEKRNQIIESAIEIFANQGYYRASIKNITDKARISLGTFYLYFKGKDDVVLAIFVLLHERLYSQIQEKAKERYDSGLSRFVACTCFLYKKFIENKELTTILVTRTIAISRTAEEEYFSLFRKMCSFFANLMNDIETVNFKNRELASSLFVQGIGTQAVLLISFDEKEKIQNALYDLIVYHLRALSVEFSEEYLKKIIKINMEDQNY